MLQDDPAGRHADESTADGRHHRERKQKVGIAQDLLGFAADLPAQDYTAWAAFVGPNRFELHRFLQSLL